MNCLKDGVWVNELGQAHREDGPAWEGAYGAREWWVSGQLHRTDGPAIEYTNGTFSWVLNDVEYTKIRWLDKLKEFK